MEYARYLASVPLVAAFVIVHMANVANRMCKDRSVVDDRAFSSLHFTFKDTDFGVVVYLSI